LCSQGDSGLDDLIRYCASNKVTFLFDALIQPAALIGRQSALSKPSPIPPSPGVYAWYFYELPPGVPVDGSVVKDGLTLLYAGISHSRSKSSQNLRKRITYH
jgi:hypothetical protein